MIAMGMFDGGVTVMITCAQTSPTTVSPLNFTVTFSIPVTGFVLGDVTVGNGTESNFAGSGAEYTFDVVPNAEGAVTIDIAANVCVEGNSAAAQFSITWSYTTVVIPITIATMLQEDFPATNLGSSTQMYTRGGATRYFTLMKADVSGIAVDAVILTATLSIFNQSTAAANRPQELYSILVANDGWAEASTWNYKIPSTTRWAGDAAADAGTDAGCSVSGTDYNATQLAAFTYLANTVADDVSLSIAQVTDWLTANYGFEILGTNSNIFAWHSDDAANSALRPYLTVVYRPAGEHG
jgi:hypothetical protein